MRLALAALSILLAGCPSVSDFDMSASVDSAEPVDLAQPLDNSILADLSTPDLSAPPDLAVIHFYPTIQNDINMLGCANGSCHQPGTSALTLWPFPAPGLQTMQNWMNFSADAMAGANSLILTKPLATSGLPHAGGKPFSSVNDPLYRRWSAWINTGRNY